MRRIEPPQIKVCGITREQEIRWLLEERVEYLGMVLFCPKSKRNLEIERAAELLAYGKEQEQGTGRTIHTVAVMVSPTKEQLEQAENLGFDFLQLHGEVESGLLQQARLPVIRAVQMSEDRIMTESVNKEGNIVAKLYDAASPGSGKAFDWNRLAEISRKAEQKLFLAGGLTPENVAEAIRTVHPDVVDVSSGVEAEPAEGKGFAGKEKEKIRRFVKAVRADRD